MVGEKGSASSTSHNNITLEGTSLDQITKYKFLDIWMDKTLPFSLQNLFLIFTMGSTFTPPVKLPLVQMMILLLFNYVDVICRAACKGALRKLVH